MKPQHPTLHLLANGGSLPVDQPFIRSQLEKVKEYAKDVEIINDLSPKGRAAFLNRCTLLSVPERTPEGYGLFLIEAAASAIPVVQPAVGPYPEILALTEGGLICPPDDLAQTMDTLLQDPAMARAMGQNARKNALERCSLTVMAKQLEQEYQRLVPV
jgi:glycosyltransferase involved in cell wall biosynthesis